MPGNVCVLTLFSFKLNNYTKANETGINALDGLRESGRVLHFWAECVSNALIGEIGAEILEE